MKVFFAISHSSNYSHVKLDLLSCGPGVMMSSLRDCGECEPGQLSDGKGIIKSELSSFISNQTFLAGTADSHVHEANVAIAPRIRTWGDRSKLEHKMSSGDL